MDTKKVWTFIALTSGIGISFVGIGLMGVYIYSAVITRMGEPDQSLLFWYLPILFIGFLGLIIGASISILSFLNLKKPNR